MSKSDFENNEMTRTPRAGIAAPHLAGFARHLRGAGYSAVTVTAYLRSAARLGRWTAERGLDLSAIELHERRRPRKTQGATAFLCYLRQEGVVPPEQERDPPEPSLLRGFRHWMLQHRGVVAATVRRYCHILVEMLDALGDDPAQWDARGIRQFVMARASRNSAEQTVTAARVFLRYLAVQGQVAPGLDHAVPGIAQWRLSALPRYVGASEVEQVIAACDPSTPVGIRDRAILLLLVRLGLRAGDVADLRFDYFDWKDGSIRVSGKGRREARLPMPQEVGDAVIAYLERGRRPLDDDHVFLCCCPPLRPLHPRSISTLVGRAFHRAGVQSPSRGAHVLRHTAATQMLRQGISLQDIAAVLRHRSLETTALYAKVDVALLREVVQPWPEVSPC